MWQTAEQIIPAGKYIAVDLTTGVAWWSVTQLEAMQRITDMAVGWSPSQVINKSNLLGFDQITRVLGRATEAVPAANVADQVANAYNSFWGITGVTASVRTSDTLSDPITDTSDPWADAITAASYAIVFVAVAYGIYQIRKTLQ